MKKKVLLSGIFALALLVAAGYGVNQKVKSNANLSDLALANVEALAQNENDPGIRIYCRCTDGNFIGFNKQCKTNGDNAVCAQGEQGGNIDCTTYNSNC
jgi:hypothetical protein